MSKPDTARRPRLNRRRLKAGLGAAVLLAAAGTGGWLWASGTVTRGLERSGDLALRISAHLGFTVAEVAVVGRIETRRPALMAAVDAERGTPLLGYDPQAAKTRIEALPWVEHASVERILPGTVLVRVQERQPLAVWQSQGRFRLIDATGTVIPGQDLERFRDLVLVVGEQAPRHAGELMRVLQTEPQMLARVRAAVWVDDRRWSLRLDNGIDVHLPAADPAGAWGWLAAYQRTHQVLARDIAELDLRLPDQLILRRASQTRPALETEPQPEKAPQGRAT